jgi:anthranilate synthase
MFNPLAYTTAGGIRVEREVAELPFATALDPLLSALDRRRGALLGSSYEYPGRYKRWSLGFVDPPLELTAKGRRFRLAALNARGRVLLPLLGERLGAHPHLTALVAGEDAIEGTACEPPAAFDEGERTRQPSVLSAVRALVDAFAAVEDGELGLYGAYAYDIVYQLEPVAARRSRPEDQRDLVAYIPDALVIVDHQLRRAMRLSYDFAVHGASTKGLPREGASFDYLGARLEPQRKGDYPAGGYADIVRTALPSFGRGDLIEVVPSQSFYDICEAAPSALYATLMRVNPSPYGFLFNLGGEYLVGASPEMYVRVEARRVETCPISGTIRRGKDALEDAERTRELLNSAKDEAELTMCTDVDRNDKSRVCEPGSVKVIGRRQIEVYSHLIHTVDHVEGLLAPGYDALDAFLSHAWAVTVTGAPKPAALAFLEANEVSPRRWYGGAVGRIGFDGNMNTGLTLRTIYLRDGIAEVRAGATLLADSVPEDEETETHVKAAALFRTLELARSGAAPKAAIVGQAAERPGAGKRLLFVDCEDSFVHTLASYFRATGAEVAVLRHHLAPAALDGKWDMVVLSPGPGRPAQFGVPDLVRAAMARQLPVFGVCLGLQGIVEALGGTLETMPFPQHGRTGEMTVTRPSLLFEGLPDRLTVGRYHSLFAASMPNSLRLTAETTDGVPMAVEHVALPVAAVQFHPESIMTQGGDRLVANVVRALAGTTALKRTA